MSSRRSDLWMFLLGAVLGIYPGVVAGAGVVMAVRRRFVSLKYGLLLAGACFFWLLPALSDVALGRVNSATWGEAGELMLVLLAALAGAGLGKWLGTPTTLAAGLISGIGALALASIVAWLGSPGRIALWMDHPNIFGASVLLPTTAALLLTKSSTARLLTLAIGFVPIGFSGSRSAILVLAAVGVCIIAVDTVKRRTGKRGRAVATIATLILSLGVVIAVFVLQPRLAALVRDVARFPLAALKPNVLGVPQALGVEVIEEGGSAVRIVAADSNWWSRLQYPLVLLPGRVYTFSAEMDLSTAGEAVGIYGAVNARDSIMMTRRLEWGARATGDLILIAVSTQEMVGGWTRMDLSFKTGSTDKSWLWIGPAPDLEGVGAGSEVVVRSIAAWEGLATSEPERRLERGLISKETNQAVARIYAFIGAWHGFLESPMFGQRSVQFGSYFRMHAPTELTAVPAHAHNALLQSLFERGLVGTMGFILMLAWLQMNLTRSKVHPGLSILLLVAIASNIADAVIWSSGMMYFLAVFAGMTSGFTEPSTTAVGKGV